MYRFVFKSQSCGKHSQGASLVECIRGFGFGEAGAQSWPFVLIPRLISVESQ
jgi:hypothetical protein